MATLTPKVIPNDSSKLTTSILNSLRGTFSISVHESDIIDLLRTWLKYCENNHDGRRITGLMASGRYPVCQNGVEDGHGLPLLLIDVEQCCLIDYKPTMRYMALSYVWGTGSAAGSKTEKSNMEALHRPGALLGEQAVVRTPNTVADAMVLTGLLGVSYLWCDRFCIVQDDPGSQANQIAQMAEIYARSYCTIIPSDSQHSDSGLNGLSMLSGKTEQWKESNLREEEQDGGRWENRGWTFQEDLFSLRMIKMSAKEIKWRCSATTESGQWYSSRGIHNNSSIPGSSFSSYVLRGPLDIDMSPHSGVLRTGGLTHPLYPCMEFYRRLVKGYTNRSFTKAEDVLNAFSGAANALTLSYPGGFIQGLPTILFSHCLLWQPEYNHFIRRTSDIGAKIKPASWSWMGWKGYITWTEESNRAFPFIKRAKLMQSRATGKFSWIWEGPNDYGTVTLVNWYTSTDIDGPRIPVAGHPPSRNFYQWSATLKDDDPLPPEAEGWSRHQERWRKRTYYTHKDFWKAEKGDFTNRRIPMSFAYPFPIPKTRNEVTAIDYNVHIPNYLHGKVQSRMFTITSTLRSAYDAASTGVYSEVPTRVAIQIASLTTDRIVGVMCFVANYELPRAGFPEVGDVIEVVAISTGAFVIPKEMGDSTSRGYEELLFSEMKATYEHKINYMEIDDVRYRPGDTYNYFNVMWVEPGIPAYRRGLGRVADRAFGNEPYEDEFVDIVLG